MPSPSPSFPRIPSLATPLARGAPVEKRTTSFYAQDLADFDRFWDTRVRSFAAEGRQPPEKKADFLRQLIHETINRHVRPALYGEGK
jgi:hypothetical protein